LAIHATLYVLVNIILITVNLLARVLPVPFPGARPVIGQTVKCLFGVRWIGEERRQANIGRHAAQRDVGVDR
jgi:hypothetical protein